MTDRVMKTLCVLFLLPVFLLCSCSAESGDNKQVNSRFSADFQAEYKEMTIKGSLSSAGRGVMNLNVAYPQTLSGLNVNYKNSEMLICRDSLECSADEAYLPSDSFPNTVYLILTGIADGRQEFESKNEYNTYNLKTSLGNCIISVDEQGNIVKAEISKTKFSITFSNVKAIQ